MTYTEAVQIIANSGCAYAGMKTEAWEMPHLVHLTPAGKLVDYTGKAISKKVQFTQVTWVKTK